MNLVPKTAAEKASKRVLAAARGQTGRRPMVPGMAAGGVNWAGRRMEEGKAEFYAQRRADDLA